MTDTGSSIEHLCRQCGDEPAVGQVHADPYDYISDSPILSPVWYCLRCYNRRVLGALNYLKKSIERECRG